MNAEKTGEFIRNLRTEKNITQLQLAELLKVSDKAVSRWETGRGFPDICNIEEIAETLGVSVAEILKGERFNMQITKADVAEVSSVSFSMARNFVAKKKRMDLAAGFLSGMIIVMILFVHLISPIPIKNAENVLSIKTLSDSELVAFLNCNVAGYDVSNITDSDTTHKYIYLSCYETVLDRLIGNDNRTVIQLGNKDDVDYVYYYPADEEDQLVWMNDGLSEPSGGFVTLPRLVYNYWLIIGIVSSLAGIAACILLRKKHFLEILVRITMTPIAFTVSIIAVLAGKFGAVYNAPYYISGILLLTISFYAFFIILFSIYKAKKKEKSNMARRNL